MAVLLLLEHGRGHAKVLTCLPRVQQEIKSPLLLLQLPLVNSSSSCSSKDEMTVLILRSSRGQHGRYLGQQERSTGRWPLRGKK